VDGITAAAIGAIAGAVVVLARRQFTDVTSVAIAAATILILLRFKKIQEPVIILAAAGPGPAAERRLVGTVLLLKCGTFPTSKLFQKPMPGLAITETGPGESGASKVFLDLI
jgi:chromate transport protein ChrA